MAKVKLYPENTLYIADTHLPFVHPHYLEFCLGVQRRVHCGTVVHLGDLVDNHSISYHEHDPDGWSPADEMANVDRMLADWFKAFPHVRLCRGNHDVLVDRKSKTAGLPKRVFRQFRDIWQLPNGWIDDFSHRVGPVHCTHGTGYSGKYAHIQAAYDNRMSTVVGHTHSAGGVQYIETSDAKIFGMNVGCGIDPTKYAFAYGKDHRFKPILGCGVTTDNGKFAQFFPM